MGELENMSKNPVLLYKTLVVGVILLLIGVVVQPGYATEQQLETNEEFVEYNTELCGFGGWNQTIKLTKEEAEEVDRLFENIGLKLNESYSRNETERILFKAVVELDKFGLLAGLGVRQAQKLVSLEYNDLNFYNSIDINNNQNPGSSQIKENFNCVFIASLTNCSLFFQNGVHKSRVQLQY